MMKIYLLIFSVVFLFSIPQSEAQKNNPKAAFNSPVNFPITLAGSFGEIRRNHLHSGIDIRTGGAEGKPVYAIADGYVSRVNVSAVGFGKALYIDHPNGYTSLYGHLQRYAGVIAKWVKAQQYSKESFTMDVTVPAGELKVKKGDLIAYSGNSGSSGGPHVHFEIRDTKSQEILNPLDFGFMEPDATLPKITGVKIYPYDQRSLVNFSDNAVSVQVTGGAGLYSIKGSEPVKVSGSIIFGIETSDAGEGGLKTGVNVIRLMVDGTPVFSQDIERFAFSSTRYVNCLIDYPEFVQHRRKIQRSYVAPNNKLGVYKDVKNSGIINFSDAKRHTINYQVKDYFGNTSTLEFQVESHPLPGNAGKPGGRSSRPPEHPFTFGADNRFSTKELVFEVPKECVYEDFDFEYTDYPAIRGSYALVHHLHNKLTPLHSWCDLKIKCLNLPPNLQSKALIVEVLSGNKFSAIGGKFEDGWVKGKIREFGNFTVSVDTIRPVIKPVNITNNKNLRNQSTIKLLISDNLSGIDTYRGTLNGKWILMDYDAKSKSLVYLIDEHMKAGKNQFVLTVTDAVGNSSKYTATLVR